MNASRLFESSLRGARLPLLPDETSMDSRLLALRQGVKVGIVSNWDGRLGHLLDGLGLGHLIDVVVSSASVGLHKPDPRIFALACERLDVQPAQCAHVGDHLYSDILGARAAGLHAVMIDRAGTGCPSSVACIRTLDELEGAL